MVHCISCKNKHGYSMICSTETTYDKDWNRTDTYPCGCEVCSGIEDPKKAQIRAVQGASDTVWGRILVKRGRRVAPFKVEVKADDMGPQ